MKHVEFTREMKPHGIGDRLIVPDDVAARLEENGDIKPNPPSFPEGAPAAQTDATQRRQMKPRRDHQSQTYLTKGHQS